MPTQKYNESPAEFVLRQGWKVGTILAGTVAYDTGPKTAAIQITAIGISSVLARRVYLGGDYSREMLWTFEYRDWVEVGK